MRYLFYFLIPWVVAFQGCSAGDGAGDVDVPEDYYFRFKVDGTLTEYRPQQNTVNLTGVKGFAQNTGTHFINVSGLGNIFENKANTFTIFVNDTRGISTGVNYSNIPGEGDAYPDFTFSMGYLDGDGNLHIAGGAGDQSMYGLYEAAFVEFSEITDSYIIGKFSGKLTHYDSSGGTNVLIGSVVISDGEFKVRLLPSVQI